MNVWLQTSRAPTIALSRRQLPSSNVPLSASPNLLEICSSSLLPTSHTQSMASTVMASHAVVVAGLGSSTVRGTPMRGLQGPVQMSKSSRPFTPIRAAKLPKGVETPRNEPKLPVSFWGFTENAEVWNSRASMIGIFGIIIVEAIIHKGILQAIGIEVGNGLDLPL